VFVPGYFELRYPPFREPTRNRITPTDCVVWATAHRLVADVELGTLPMDWRIDLNATDDERRKVTDEIERCLISGAVPFLDLFDSLEDVIDFLTHRRTGLGASAWTSDILCLEATGVLYALLGNHDKAVEHIDLAIHKTKIAEARTYQHRVREAIDRYCSASTDAET
jgi:hypothetical protein